jgi:zinc transport system permease protein
VTHGDHVDYVHDGHLHAAHEGHYDEHGVHHDEDAHSPGHDHAGEADSTPAPTTGTRP